GDSDIYYKKSTDRGRSWSSPQRLTDAPEESMVPVVTAVDGRVHVAWKDRRDQKDGEVYYKGSRDGGDTWSVDKRLTHDEVKSGAATMVVANEQVHLAWENANYHNRRAAIEYSRSLDRGEGWEDVRSLEEPINGCPSLAVGEGDVIDAVYCSSAHSEATRGYNFEVYFKQSRDGGQTWPLNERLTFDEVGDSRFPIIAAAGRDLHVVWWDDRQDTTHEHMGYPPREPEHNFEIYYKRSLDHGATWEEDARLTHDDGVSSDPTLDARGTGVYVVWVDDRSGKENIYFKNSRDRGATWGPDTALTTHQGRTYARRPSVAVDDQGTVYVMWTSNSPGAPQVFLSRGVPR
ncbi:MAG: sialidase family protein, partial [Myxococcota bacterium]|nr:sialidase family protein [Myxococcota bacterium]